MDAVIEYGPMMQRLTGMRRAFVMALVSHPGMAKWKVAEIAGYSGGEVACKVRASELMHQQPVLDAIVECTSMAMRSNALVAANVLIDIASREDAPLGERRKCAEALLDRIGLGAQQNINVEHTHTDRTGAALMDRIRELARKHGLDAQQLLAGTSPGVSQETLAQDAVVIEGKAEPDANPR